MKHAHKGNEWLVGKAGSWLRAGVVLLLLHTLLLVTWEYLGTGNEFFWSRPSLVAGYALQYRYELLMDTWASAGHVLIGWAPGVVIGIGWALIAVMYQRWSRVSDALMGEGLSFPRYAVLQMIVLWVGIRLESVLVFNFFETIVLTAPVCYQGAQAVLRDSPIGVRYIGNRASLFKLVLWPMTRSYRFLAMKQSVGLIWPSIIISEYMVMPAGPGLGSRVSRSGFNFSVEGVVVAALLITLAAVTTRWVIKLVEDRWVPKDRIENPAR